MRPAADLDPLPPGRGEVLMIAGLLLVIASYVTLSWPPLVAGVLLLIAVWYINRPIWPQVLREAAVKPVCFARRGKVPPPPSPGRPAPAPGLASHPPGQRARP
jgi:hypothetical protein